MRYAVASIVFAVIAIACPRVAGAEDKVLVLRAEGRADKKLRTKIEGAVLKLAQSTGEPTTAGDVTFGDAAMMVGCKPDEDKCKDEVLGMLAVDEIVAITATPKPGGIEVAVRRISKGATTRNAATLVTPDKADQLDALAPLFNASSSPVSPLPPPVAVTHPPAPTAIQSTTPPAPITTPINPAPAPVPPPVATTPAAPTTTASIAPLPEPGQTGDQRDDDRPRGNRRLAKIGMAGGGALLVVGIVFWASAANIESQIKDAPKRTRDDLEYVQDLEAEGDGYATAGNLLALSGLVLGGVSTYFFLKSGKQPTHSASVAPIVGHGTGIAITFGGSL